VKKQSEDENIFKKIHFFIYTALNADINNVYQLIILKSVLFQSSILLLLTK